MLSIYLQSRVKGEAVSARDPRLPNPQPQYLYPAILSSMYSRFLHTVLQIRIGDYYYYYYTCYGYTIVVKLYPGIKLWKMSWGTERKWYWHCPTGLSGGDECLMTFLTYLTLLHQPASIDTIESFLAYGSYHLFTQERVSSLAHPYPCPHHCS